MMSFAVTEKGKTMSDYIKREDAIGVLMETIAPPSITLDTLVMRMDNIPSDDVVERSVLLEEADRQENIGFIQTADVLRKVAEK